MERPGDTLESGSMKEPRADWVNPQQDEGTEPKQDPPEEHGWQRDVNMEDYGIFPSNDDHVRVALVPQDFQNATFLPVAGWPPYLALCGRDPPAPVSSEAPQIAELGDLDYRATYNRVAGADIAPSALAAAGAERVDPSEWPMMNEQGDLYSPAVLLDYEVYRLPPRRVRGH